ncbi:hypothetical protein OGAPHI_006989 [Ogataea philodendri]|uniref:Transfer RNA methyltransferase 82 n=1 Tax=Ogataea philodendri TaxID=1378263 RepID=A0A9P8NV19_9ASCO|nr:uncharacterized protein OGAPHI_006989 [Ogataea philodendri]KAH3660403.1 hypothetical protein OGAPHI_006989 [Ogataea philodendri]
MKHPFQKVLLNSDASLLFAAAGNKVYVFSGPESWKLVDSWVDTVDPNYSLIKEYEARIQRYEQEVKESGSTDHRPPKVPTPGAGAPAKICYIRDIQLSRNEKYLILTTDTDKAVVVFEIIDGHLKEVKRQPLPKRTCSITTSLDDTKILVGDKFGDVYSVDTLDPEIVSEKDLVPVLGHVSMLTSVLNIGNGSGKEFVITTDRDEHIRISQFPKSYVIENWLFEHEEFISSIVAPQWCDNKVLISAGGDKFICSWNWQEGSLVDKFDYSADIEPFLTAENLAPSRFQNEEGDLMEYAVSQLIQVPKLNKLVVLFDRLAAFFVVSVSADGKLALDKSVSVSSTIICGAANNNRLILSVKGDENCLLEYNLENWEHKELTEVYGCNDVEWNEKGDLFASFSVNQLRKRSEH